MALQSKMPAPKPSATHDRAVWVHLKLRKKACGRALRVGKTGVPGGMPCLKIGGIEWMVAHLGGFEPSTNRFVAEYSIQLSYRCTPCEKRSRQVAHLGGFEPSTNRFVAEYSIQLSYRCMRLATFLRWHIIPAQIAFTSFFEKAIAPFINRSQGRPSGQKPHLCSKPLTGILDAPVSLL